MTDGEWLEVVDWVASRFKSWTPDQAIAYFDDLSHFNAEDVWDAMYRLYDRGLDFAPNGSQLRKETAVVVRERMERARWDAQGLPAPSTDSLSWETWRTSLGYEGLTVEKAIERRHGELFPRGCAHRGCEVCGNMVDPEPARR